MLYQRILIIFFLLPFRLMAQNPDLLNMLEKEDSARPSTVYTIATFKTTRLINGASVQQLAGGVMDVKISHRFGTISNGIYDLFGLDNASNRFGVDYGINNWLMIGLGRSSYEKQYDGFAKVRILRQSKGEINMPLTLSGFVGIYYNTLKWADPSRENFTSSRVNYSFQLLAARKFSEGFSLQLTPTLVHYNLVPLETDKNDLLSVGIGARQKLSKRVSFNIEYFYQIPGYKLEGTENSLSAGFDIETGGHVFQFMFTNSTGIAENQFITKTTDSWSKGDIHFGFNVARVFTLSKPKTKK